MKKVLAVILIICMLGLTGCVRMVEITDEESETIARTAAWLLFKYDKNYTENLVTPIPTATPIPVPTETPTPTPVPEVQEAPDNFAEPDIEGDAPEEVSLPESDASVDEVLGLGDIILEYDGYELYDSYTFDSFSVEPKKPENCLMLIFLQLQNSGDGDAMVNLLEMQPKCRLYVDISEQKAPMRTVLLNDFQYLVAEITPGESYNSVLVFEVEKEFAPDTLDLFISVGENTAHMNLQ